ncbi:MAG TPA: hypothetical protein VFI47_31325, partial [Acidimicrobiales bacterium]|nr:hypothetical protein [Acidimicrobiales bacterium]
LWNPFVPLLPWLCAVFLAWDVALGNRRALWALAVAACFAAQTHLAFATLTVVVVVWLAAWSRWWPRLLPPAAARDGWGGEAGADTGADDPPRRVWAAWWRTLLGVGVLVGVLWLPPLFDALFDLHNPVSVARSIATPPPTVGPVSALGLVGRYVRPDGPWIGGEEPSLYLSVQGSGPVPLVLALAVVAGCVAAGRRRRLVDVVALSSLTLVLVVAAVPAAAQIFLPAYAYLTQFLKLVGGLVWLTVAWTVWRLGAGWVAARPPRRAVVGAVTIAGLVVAVASSWGDAVSADTPHRREEPAVQALRAQLVPDLAAGETVRVEYTGDPFNVVGPGVIYWLIHDEADLLTSDGGHGLKWGHAHRWQRGEPYDRLLTVAVNYGPDTASDAVSQCEHDPRARPVAEYNALGPADLDWLAQFEYGRYFAPDAASPADVERADELAGRRLHVVVFEGPAVCAQVPKAAKKASES